MTDRFEEAVRQAARGLSDSAGADMPTYHDAWQRGRRRRMRKQAGMTFAGAVLMLGALAGLSNLSTRTAVEVDDVALEAQAATSIPEVPTTAPVPVPGGPVADDLDAPTPVVIETATAMPDATATAAPAPTETASAPEPAPPAPEASPTATSVQPAPTATTGPSPVEPLEPAPEPTIEVAATGPAATGPSANDQATNPETTELGDGTAQDSATQDNPAPETALGPDASTDRQPEAPATSALPNITLIGPNQKPDATILGKQATGDQVPCDRNGDAQVDAQCRLLPRYSCSGDGDVRPAYLPIDLDEDGEFDTCVASGLTACDTTGDGLADTPCTIELEIVTEDG